MRLQSRLAPVLAAALIAPAAHAVSFELPYGGGITGTLNTSFTLGTQWRMQGVSPNLVSKTAQNPNLCPVAPNGAGTSCQGHLDEPNAAHAGLNSFVGEGAGADTAFVRAPGQASNNNDDGDLNFHKHQMTQAVSKASMDLSMKWSSVEVFMRGYYFYNPLYDNPYMLFNPNIQTARTTSGAGQLRRGIGESDTEAIISPNPGVGASELGTSFKLLDANIATSFDLLGQKVSVKAGRQPINWGESTLLIVNSLNTFNPPNVNALFRPAFLQLEEVLTPVGAIVVSTSIVENLSADVFYQYDWQAAEIPPPGSFFSNVNVGSRNSRGYLYADFGKAAQDPNCLGLPDQLMLSAVTDTCGRFQLLPEKGAKNGGQGGIKLQYFADWLNHGTTLAFYAANYHSRLPMLSFYEAQYSCLNGPTAPVPSGVGTTDTANVLAACPGADGALVAEAALGSPNRDQNIGANGNAITVDTQKAQLEYPENIHLMGLSFNTTVGDISLQGEVAYRPNQPLQVSTIDLAFASLQNSFPAGCEAGPSATCVPGSSADKFNIDPGIPGVGTVAQLPGERYAIPDYVSAYRGVNPHGYAPGAYIRGYERFKTAQYDLGMTYVMGATDQPLGADQIILIGEAGVDEVFGLPSLDELQIEGPGTFTHYSAGADGSGASNAGAAGTTCPETANSSVCGASGIRFNPTRQATGWVTPLSGGYRFITLARYEGVLPGVNIENTLVWSHDVFGVGPGPGENFVAGRKTVIENMEFRLPRYAEGLSVAAGYVWFFGGGVYNLLSDRDFAQVGLRYRF